jgi:hypothetical protein
MRKNKWLVRVLIAALATAGLSEAAEKIRCEEIPARLEAFGNVIAQPDGASVVIEHRGIVLTTLDGKEHRGRTAHFEPTRVRVFHGKDSVEDLPIEQVSRIEISQGGRFFHHVVGGAAAPVEMGEFFCEVLGDLSQASPTCVVVLTAVLSPWWAYTAVTTPFFLAADGVAFLIPPTVYEIVH